MELTTEEKAWRTWLDEPEEFIANILGTDLWEKQIEIAHAIRDHQRVAVKSCNSAGKTHLAACVLLQFLYTRPNSLVLTTASTGRQVKNQIWRRVRRTYNIAKAAGNPLGGRLLQQEIQIDDEWYAMGFSTDDSERVSGFHAPHILFIVDEPGLIDPEIMGAIEGILSSGEARLLMIGNPTQDEGAFYDAFHGEAENYHRITISAFDTPNLQRDDGDGPLTSEDLLGMSDDLLSRQRRPYLISREWVRSRLRAWGSESALYKVRVLAEFPESGGDHVFPMDLLERCVGRSLEPIPQQMSVGIDVARQGVDETAYATLAFDGMAEQLRGQLMGLEQSDNTNVMSIANRARALFEDFPSIEIGIDDNGVGGGVTDRLWEQDYEAQAFLAGAKAPEAPYTDRDRYRSLYANAAAWSFWSLREAMRDDRFSFAPSIDPELLDQLINQLLTITYAYERSSRIKIDKRGGDPSGKSPDLADALAIAWWTAYHSATPGVGKGGGHAW